MTTSLSQSSLERIDEACDRFEAAWKNGQKPSIDDYLDGAAGPEHEALLADSVGLALLVVLETLSPAERLGFVLHDMFAVSFDEIALIIARSPTSARHLASRARRRVQGAARAPDADPARQRQVVDAPRSFA